MSELPPAKDMEDLSGLFVRCEQDPEEPFQQRLQILRRMMDTAEKASEQFKQIWQQMEDWREEDIDELNEKEHQEVLRARELARTSARASSLGQSVPIQSPPPGAAASSSGPPARSYGVPWVRTAAEIIARGGACSARDRPSRKTRNEKGLGAAEQCQRSGRTAA